ncbi:GNAT family N-acetyltransferase [Polymorphospora lycopeni]|uniref:GNAT family N-acetyltransferase n=1 Tax=Polymorphospora lycopeni TaxID=3140240 RepID=A0ABV5CK45_9ACTN
MDGPISVREATLADLDRILDVHAKARTAYYRAGGLALEAAPSPETERDRRTGWTSAIRGPDQRAVCAVADGDFVGIAAMGPPLSPEVDAGTAGQLYQIHVRPDSWGRGVGGILHASFVRCLEDAALPAGLLEVWERNTRARAFYARNGWRPDGGFRPGPDDANYICLRLESAALLPSREHAAT